MLRRSSTAHEVCTDLVVEGIRNVSEVLGMCEISLLEGVDLRQRPVLNAQHGVLVLSLRVQHQTVLIVVTQRSPVRVQHHRWNHC